MGRWCRTAIIVVAVGLLVFTACRAGSVKAALIQVSPTNVQPGAVVRVSGQNWRPGERVTIGLNAPNARPQDSQTVTTALTDATGSFVALFAFPRDERWTRASEIQVVAHSADFGKVALANVHYAPPVTATPVSRATASATPSAGASAYVSGYVVNTSTSARIIKVRPIEGQAEVIALTERTQITRNGQPVQLEDVHIGDLVEASGQAGANKSIIADLVRILATATVQPTATTTPTQPAVVWRGAYYNNTTFSGNPTLVRDDALIDFQWQEDAAAAGLPADYFAVRWTASWPLDTGAYRFYTQVDDGVRLWLDEHLIIDQWHESIGALYHSDAYLSAGLHAIKVEYFDGRGRAHARVWWEYQGQSAAQTYPDWKGEYYANMALYGTPFLMVNDRLLDFDWRDGAPASGMPADNFSARWTRTVNLQAGLYRFRARSDDGVRLWVNNTLAIDHWQDGAAENYFGELYLPGGDYNIRVEYYEHTGLAVIQVGWELLPNTPTPTHTPTQTPTSTPLLPTATPTAMPTHTPTPPILVPTHTPVLPGDLPTLTPKPKTLAPFTLHFPLVTSAGRRARAPVSIRKIRKLLGGPPEGW